MKDLLLDKTKIKKFWFLFLSTRLRHGMFNWAARIRRVRNEPPLGRIEEGLNLE